MLSKNINIKHNVTKCKFKMKCVTQLHKAFITYTAVFFKQRQITWPEPFNSQVMSLLDFLNFYLMESTVKQAKKLRRFSKEAM